MIISGVIAVFLITLGLGQFGSTWQGWRGASLVGPSRLAGYSLGVTLLGLGAWLLPPSGWVISWTLLTGPLALGVLLLAGSYILPPPHPNGLFDPQHPAHRSCQPVQIPDGGFLMPGLFLTPPANSGNLPHSPWAVCLVHGAGDTKISFKWRLVQALLAEGMTVLTIDLPGHGDYRQRPLAYPDCLSAIPAAISFLRQQPGVERVGLVGISLGSAIATRSLAKMSQLGAIPPLKQLTQDATIDALVALEMPLQLKYSQTLFYREMWQAYRAPVLSLLGETTARQMRQSWFTGGYVSRHKNTGEVIELLNPLEAIAQLRLPILLVHGGRDSVAPVAAGQALQQVAPQATLWEVKRASHVTLTLMPEVNQQAARWLKERLEGEIEEGER